MAYQTTLKNAGKGQMHARLKKTNVQRGSLSWTPPDDKQYFLVIDNTRFPDGGSRSGRTIHYSLAFCIDDPKPKGPKKGNGIIIGRATLDYDNYEGKSGREHKPFKVIVEVLDGGFFVSAGGTARESGSMGEYINVYIDMTKTTISCKIMDSKTVITGIGGG